MKNSERKRTYRSDKPLPEKSIISDYEAENSMRMQHSPQASSVSNQSVNDRKERRRERARRYREQHREALRKKQRDYRKRQNIQLTGSSSEFHETDFINDDTISNQRTKAKELRKERDRRYRENNRQLINQRKRENRRKQNIQQTSGDFQVPNTPPQQGAHLHHNHQDTIENINEEVNVYTAEVPNSEVGEMPNSCAYTNYIRDKTAHNAFMKNFRNNKFEHACSVYERLWFEKDLKSASSSHEDLIRKITNIQDITTVKIGSACETWLDNEENADIPNFDCIVQFKRNTVRPDGVAIYQNRDTLNIITSRIIIRLKNARVLGFGQGDIGDLCATQIVMEDGRELVMVIVYISPNQKITDIIKFLHEELLKYSAAGSKLIGSNLHELPLILAGDFNINFANVESSPLINFLRDEFQLIMNNDASEPTTRYETTIDTVFSRYMENDI